MGDRKNVERKEPKYEKQYKMILLINVCLKSVERCSKSAKMSGSGTEGPVSG